MTSAINTADIRQTYLVQCGPCDYGLVQYACNCPPGDIRAVLKTALDELDRMVAAAHQLRRAMVDQHSAAGHALDVHAFGEDCKPCIAAADETDGALACEQWQQWQASYEAALIVRLPDVSPPAAGVAGEVPDDAS